MQTDSHYHATYAMARAAGIEPDIAQTIATCAQFVDDNVAETCVTLRDGSRVQVEATAHHTVDTENLEPHDQRQVWVPFHFLPGNEGNSFAERLKCRKDSVIAREMVAHHLELADKPFAISLMGVAAHVYADTFSHFGFSGVSSGRNKVVNDSFELSEDLDPEIRKYILEKFRRFRRHRGAQLLDNFRSWVGEVASGALGHGPVGTFPDRPYLAWSFEYETMDAVEGKRSIRDNRVTFLAGFEALHTMFREFVARRPDLGSGDGREFDDIRAAVKQVVAVQAPEPGRMAAWQAAAHAGSVFGRGHETIPEYQGQLWNDRWRELDGADNSSAVHQHPVWRFYQAAAIHRTHVLRDLLPRHGLIVD